MLAAAAAVAVPPAAACFPRVNPGARGWRSSWRSRRASRISAEYSQLEVTKISYRPPGTEQNLLHEISLSLQEKSFGLIFGRSGSGKATLLQLLAGLSQPTSGSICIQKYNDRGNPRGLPEFLTSERVGIVFQFPERYFLADTVLEEVTFGWPRQKADLAFKEQLAINLQNAFNSVGLRTISLDEDPQSLSGGFKRRHALAIQLVQTPDLLLLDEPLAGLGELCIIILRRIGLEPVQPPPKYKLNFKLHQQPLETKKKGTTYLSKLLFSLELGHQKVNPFCPSQLPNSPFLLSLTQSSYQTRRSTIKHTSLRCFHNVHAPKITKELRSFFPDHNTCSLAFRHHSKNELVSIYGVSS